MSIMCNTMLENESHTFFSTDRAKVHLEEYFKQSRLISEDSHLSLLCIQCFEVSIL